MKNRHLAARLAETPYTIVENRNALVQLHCSVCGSDIIVARRALPAFWHTSHCRCLRLHEDTFDIGTRKDTPEWHLWCSQWDIDDLLRRYGHKRAKVTIAAVWREVGDRPAGDALYEYVLDIDERRRGGLVDRFYWRRILRTTARRECEQRSQVCRTQVAKRLREAASEAEQRSILTSGVPRVQVAHEYTRMVGHHRRGVTITGVSVVHLPSKTEYHYTLYCSRCGNSSTVRASYLLKHRDAIYCRHCDKSSPHARRARNSAVARENRYNRLAMRTPKELALCGYSALCDAREFLGEYSVDSTLPDTIYARVELALYARPETIEENAEFALHRERK